MGFNQLIGAEFMCSTGLIKVGHSQNPNATIVIKSEWDKFILEEKLHDVMEAVNQNSISSQHHFFINIGDKRMLNHCPIYQFNGKVKQQPFGAYLSAWHQKLHKDISEILVSLHHPRRTFDETFEDALT